MQQTKQLFALKKKKSVYTDANNFKNYRNKMHVRTKYYNGHLMVTYVGCRNVSVFLGVLNF